MNKKILLNSVVILLAVTFLVIGCKSSTKPGVTNNGPVAISETTGSTNFTAWNPTAIGTVPSGTLVIYLDAGFFPAAFSGQSVGYVGGFASAGVTASNGAALVDWGGNFSTNESVNYFSNMSAVKVDSGPHYRFWFTIPITNTDITFGGKPFNFLWANYSVMTQSGNFWNAVKDCSGSDWSITFSNGIVTALSGHSNDVFTNIAQNEVLERLGPLSSWSGIMPDGATLTTAAITVQIVITNVPLSHTKTALWADLGDGNMTLTGSSATNLGGAQWDPTATSNPVVTLNTNTHIATATITIQAGQPYTMDLKLANKLGWDNGEENGNHTLIIPQGAGTSFVWTTGFIY